MSRPAWPRAEHRGETPPRQPAGRRRYGRKAWHGSSFFRAAVRSAAVLGGCRAGVPPGQPTPLPILQLCFRRIFGHIANRPFELLLASNEAVIILPLPKN